MYVVVVVSHKKRIQSLEMWQFDTCGELLNLLIDFNHIVAHCCWVNV